MHIYALFYSHHTLTILQFMLIIMTESTTFRLQISKNNDAFFSIPYPSFSVLHSHTPD